MHTWLRNLNTDFKLNNCLFRSVKLTKNSDPDKYKYSRYGVGFDSCSELSFRDGSMGRNVIIFEADMRGRDNLILGEGSTQELDDTTLTAETKYPVNLIK